MANLLSGRKQMVLAFLYAGISAAAVVLLTILLNSFSWFLFLSYLLLALLLTTAYCLVFLRSHRKNNIEPGAVYAPSVGYIHDIELIKHESMMQEAMKDLFDGHDVIRIGIQTSRFHLHTNRAPIDMKVSFISEDTDSVTLGAMAKIEELLFPTAIRRISKNNGNKIFTGILPDSFVFAGTVIGSVPASFRTELFLPAGLGIDLSVKAGCRVSTITPVARIYPATLEKIRQSKFNETTCKEIKES